MSLPSSSALNTEKIFSELIKIKNILLISTGGTIASSECGKGLAPAAAAEELLKFVPEYKEICRVSCVSPFCIDSSRVKAEHWLRIAEIIRENYLHFDGFVITHGTDTMAYTACAVSLLVKNSKKPIALTGAQRPVFSADTDAKRNLLDALRFAASEHHGTKVVFGGRITEGLCAKKLHTADDDAFISVNCPFVCEAESFSGETRFYSSLETDIAVIKLVPSMSPCVFEAAKRCKGVVLEAYGMGGADDECIEKLKELSMLKIPVVVTTQAIFGGCDLSVYAVGNLLKDIPYVIETGKMTFEAATVTLMHALAETSEIGEIKKYFMQNL